jgi:DNA polymerase-3 subunit epsilon
LVNSFAQLLRSPEVDDDVREIVLDTETTGLNPAEGHRVLEIGAVEIVHQTLTGRIFHTLINPAFASVVDEFLAFIGDSGLVIHNAEFDIGFVNAELARLGRDPIGMDRVVDTLVLARRKHPGQPNSLDALCDRYRIDRSRRIRHGALLDAEILADIYCELTGGRQRSLALGDAGGLAGPVAVALFPRLGERPRRQLPIPREEASAHAQYIRSLGEHAIWFRYLVSPA